MTEQRLAEAGRTRVAVCVITYRRPNGLARLLEGLNNLTFEGDLPDLRCIVVDNDVANTAREVCEKARRGFRWQLECYVEPRRGIPHARNTAIVRAGPEIDYLAFIDDDEVPEPQWLGELLRVTRQFEADVATGPVLPFFVEEPPAWIIRGKFYERNRYPTGRQLSRAFTGNILFRPEVFETMTTHFDERMALTGGSDSHFLRRVHRAGFKIVWADAAVVSEWVPPSRVGAKWILQRAYRAGTNLAVVRRDFYPILASTAMLLTIGAFRVLAGVLLLPIGLVSGRHRTVSCVCQICYGMGLLAGMAGVRYEEYGRTHGA